MSANVAANTTVVITLPTTRGGGKVPLALTEIASVVLTKSDGTNTSKLEEWDAATAPLTPVLNFTDPAPDFGDTDIYSVTVTDIEGNTSAAGVAQVQVPASTLAAPDAPVVTAQFNPAVGA